MSSEGHAQSAGSVFEDRRSPVECETNAEKAPMQGKSDKRITVSQVFAVGLGVFAIAGASFATVDSPFIHHAPHWSLRLSIRIAGWLLTQARRPL